MSLRWRRSKKKYLNKTIKQSIRTSKSCLCAWIKSFIPPLQLSQPTVAWQRMSLTDNNLSAGCISTKHILQHLSILRMGRPDHLALGCHVMLWCGVSVFSSLVAIGWAQSFYTAMMAYILWYHVRLCTRQKIFYFFFNFFKVTVKSGGYKNLIFTK